MTEEEQLREIQREAEIEYATLWRNHAWRILGREDMYEEMEGNDVQSE